MQNRIKKYIKNKIIEIYETKFSTFFFKQSGFCPCCEQETLFVAKHSWLRDHFKCNKCGCIPRERALMQVIKQYYPNWEFLSIHESSPGNRGHSKLLREKVRNYTETQFFKNRNLGDFVDGIRNEDLEQQTFNDEIFDIVITSDVMEHIYNPKNAFKEIQRTLKVGGAHIFSVPIINKHKATQRWAKKGIDGEPIFLFKPEWHGNPIDSKGSPVTFHWGYDIKNFIEDNTGATCEIIYTDDLNYGIRAEYIEIVVQKKN
jgi:hypothetical protein